MKSLEALREELARNTGARDALLLQLKQDHGLDSLEESAKYLDLLNGKKVRLTKRREELQESISKLLRDNNAV